ncbi:MAG: hypothetical protein QNJ64_18790 [Crocosphaera sp.]|nr:hypothetical protein [Crocosphaera sp.]
MTQLSFSNLTQSNIISLDASDKNYQRYNKRLEINKGKSVKLVFNQAQIRYPCEAKIINDSFNGCGLIIREEWLNQCDFNLQRDQPFMPGKKLLLLIQDIEPIQAQIMWSKELDGHDFRIGLKYLCSKILKTQLFLQKTALIDE